MLRKTMKYRDLIQFESVESVIKLRQADDHAQAEHLVSTYVISDRMADVLLHRIIPALDMNGGRDNGALFIVGNYGTGKSHLMSMISAVSEHADLTASLTHPAVAEKMGAIAGRYKVVRQECGSTNMPLRDVILGYLQEGLAAIGVDVSFPSMDEAPNNKDLLAEMMAKFHQKYPQHGLLLVIDELLEYLQGRNTRQLIVDLAFLRELGESCGQFHLRFLGGLQESLFDNDRFQFAADSIRRVRDRFEQVRIVREDVAYVVSRRLLAKTSQQKGRIRAHLEQFTALYESMAERLDEFVELFPIHPAYLEILEQAIVIEKRQALNSISQEMRRWLDREVPKDEPGLVSFDAYWRMLKDDPTYRTSPELREVLEKSQVLEERVTQSLKAPYQQAAIRIIHALSLHRLTTGTLRAPIGMTPAELRDRLCLFIPIPVRDAEFMLTSIESTLTNILKAVSGQFISRNEENDQYYLDLDKDIDFDALVDQRADALSGDNDTLDRYYFEVLARALELTDSTYVPGFRIWQREIPWPGRGITRDGYIFLGATEERSTAQPERDFYLHFWALFTNGKPASDPHQDTVIFVLKHWDETFHRALQRYAGAREMASISSGSNKTQYERKADGLLREMGNWLTGNLVRAFEVHYGSQKWSVTQLLAEHRLGLRDLNLRDQIFSLTSAVLKAYFEQRYPQYPTFQGMQLTLTNLPQAANAGLRAIAGGPVSRQVQIVLDALGLIRQMDGVYHFTPEDSPYARRILEQVKALPPNSVLNRNTLLGGDTRREREPHFGLEPELLSLVLLTLVRQGEIIINWMGRKLGADDLDEAARLGVEDLQRFQSITRPKDLPEQALRALFAALELPEGYISDAARHEDAVRELGRKVQGELSATLQAEEALRAGLSYGREAIMSTPETQALRAELQSYRQLLDEFARLKQPGQLRNFSLGVGEVRQRVRPRQQVQQVLALQSLLQSLQPAWTYLAQGEISLPMNHAWQTEVDQMRQQQIAWLRDPQERASSTLAARLKGGLDNLIASYQQAYIAIHRRARLDFAQDERKQKLTRDTRWQQARALAAVALLPEVELRKLEEQLRELRSCPSCTASDLKARPTCPNCGLVPRDLKTDAPALGEVLQAVETGLADLHARWLTTLQAELNKPAVREDIALLPQPQRDQVQALAERGELPARPTQDFVQALNDVLQGLEKVVINGTDLLLALTRPGMPCTRAELQARLNELLVTELKGKDAAKVRIQVDW
jgi:hypothetical protein